MKSPISDIPTSSFVNLSSEVELSVNHLSASDHLETPPFVIPVTFPNCFPMDEVHERKKTPTVNRANMMIRPKLEN
jgi:hypothetical protein